MLKDLMQDYSVRKNLVGTLKIRMNAQKLAFSSFGFLLLSSVSLQVQAEEITQCYAPSPALQFEESNANKPEFGIRTPPELFSVISPDKSVVHTPNYAVGADVIIYNQSVGTFEATGGVQIVADDYQLDGESATVIADEDKLEISDAEFGLFEADENDQTIRYKRARGSAEGIRFEEGIFYLESGEFTHCPDGNDDVIVSASELTLDAVTRQGVARNSKIRYKGVTILALPYFRFPIGSERLSGFLFPTLGVSGSRGTTIEAPYYFNLAPNRDATVTPKFYSKRGFQLQGEYRYLGAYSDFQFVGEYMPRDKKFLNRAKRYGAEVVGNMHDGGSFYSNFDVSWVSDPEYLDDYTGEFSDQNRDYLLQNFSLSYSDFGLVVSTGVNKFITSDETVKEVHEPYDRQPWFSVAYATPLSTNTELTTNLDWDTFRHAKKPNARRFRGESAVNMTLSNSFSEVDFQVGTEYLRYRLKEPEENQFETMSISSNYASVDGRLYFDRYGTGDSSRKWTLVPRVKLLATNSVDQDNLPEFDTTLGKLDSYEQLFQDSPYIGGDRLLESNQVSVGVTAKFVEPVNSSLTGSVGFGRIYYPNGHTSSLKEPEPDEDASTMQQAKPEETSEQAVERKEINNSDIFVETQLANPETKFKYTALIDTEKDKIFSSTMRLSHMISDNSEITSIYRHYMEGQSQWGNAISTEHANNWTSKLLLIRSFSPNELEKASISLDYASCCSRVGLELKRERELDDSFDNSISLIFDLTPRF